MPRYDISTSSFIVGIFIIQIVKIFDSLFFSISVNSQLIQHFVHIKIRIKFVFTLVIILILKMNRSEYGRGIEETWALLSKRELTLHREKSTLSQ